MLPLGKTYRLMRPGSSTTTLPILHWARSDDMGVWRKCVDWNFYAREEVGVRLCYR